MGPITPEIQIHDEVAEVIQGIAPSKTCHSADLSFVGYIITQPALDDVPVGFYPSPETENEVRPQPDPRLLNTSSPTIYVEEKAHLTSL